MCSGVLGIGDRGLGIAGRKVRERAEREHRIVAAARRIAESEGWDAVTIRRLASEIEYSQPVLYSHFENRDAIVTAVAVEGFQEITVALREAESGSTERRDALENVAMAYLAFALSRPALYEAMFVLPTNLRFAEAGTRPQLGAAFEALAIVVAPFCDDVAVVTEAFWAALHGFAELERSGRIRPRTRGERIALIVRAIAVSEGSPPDQVSSGPSAAPPLQSPSPPTGRREGSSFAESRHARLEAAPYAIVRTTPPSTRKEAPVVADACSEQT
jgi:AcrR family transcriptional regulator